MAFAEPVTLSARGVTLAPLALAHEAGLRAAAADGALWNIRVTSVPEPDDTRAYIAQALAMDQTGSRLSFVVLESASGKVLGCTSYHDIVPAIQRVEIGWTWYAQSAQRSHVNTTCKLLLLTHAFETLGCHVVGWRADNYNFASQTAIERLGAKKDGVIRGHALRRDGTIRDTVMYSMRAGEWPEAKAQLLYLLDKPRTAGATHAA
jgi:RimJ/RimL family protein N-acetyltransferase